MQKADIDDQGAVRCPRCAATEFTVGRTGKGIIGSAATGALLLGPAGLLGAAAAKKRITCLACGEVFKFGDRPQAPTPRDELGGEIPSEPHDRRPPIDIWLDEQGDLAPLIRRSLSKNLLPTVRPMLEGLVSLLRRDEDPTLLVSARLDGSPVLVVATTQERILVIDELIQVVARCAPFEIETTLSKVGTRFQATIRNGDGELVLTECRPPEAASVLDNLPSGAS